MTPTITITNPPPPATMPPTPGPGDVRLGWVAVTGTKPPIPKLKWAGGNISKQHRQKGRTR